jgi:hypothetical protein
MIILKEIFYGVYYWYHIVTGEIKRAGMRPDLFTDRGVRIGILPIVGQESQ